MKFRVALLFLLYLISTHNQALAGWGGLEKSEPHRIHYLGIGQKELFSIEGETVSSDFACSDVERVRRHLLKRASGPDSFRTVRNCGKLTRGDILTAFEGFVQSSRSNDYFVFYFGGFTARVKTGSQIITAFFISPPDISSTEEVLENVDSALYFTIADLRLWMNAIPPRNQIILIEAGFTNELKSEFSQMLLESSKVSGLLENRKRVLIFPQGVGIEDNRLKSGRFTWAMTNGLDTLGWNLTDVFDRQKSDEFEFACWKSYVEVNKDGFNAGKGINLVREWELQSLILPGPQAALRGENIAVNAGSLNEKITDSLPRFFAFLCATNEYQYWNKLSNPVADARALGEVLSKKYGFHVKLLLNPASMEDFREALQKFTDSVHFGPRDELLVFIAGHGQYNNLDKAGYIAFGNSHQNKVSEMQEQRNLLNLLDNRPCKKIMLVLDVCFGGLVSQGLISQGDPRLCFQTGSYPRGVWPYTVHNPEQVHKYLSCANRVYLTSGGYEYVSDGIPGAHSPFAAAFIAALDGANDELLLADEVITGVKKRIGTTGNTKQMPTSGRFGFDNNSTDFVFVRKN